ncbi:MAG: hypothetical protein C0524_09030 [Rhodobacter sp.]|nr:hypothetical protein [Rhodobacter sp.]
MAESWERYFQPGEALVWEGAPKPGVHGLAKIIGLAVFGLPFLGAGIGMLVAGLRQIAIGASWADIGLGLFLSVFALPFAGAGALMVVGQWWAAHEAHGKIRYALSTRAAYIAKSYWARSIETYPILPSTATGLEKGRTADTVWFHVRSEKDSDGDRTTIRIAFDNIADGLSVYRMIRSIRMGPQ